MYASAVACTSGWAQNAYAPSYGMLSHLWPSHAHESASSIPVDERGRPRARRRPQPEGAVDVDPCSDRARRRDDRGQVVAGARVDVAGLRADDRRLALTARERRGQGVRVHRAVRQRRHLDDRALAQTEEAHGAIDRPVPLRADDDPHLRRAVQAVPADVPAAAVQDEPATRREPDRVRGLRTGGEPDRRGRREAEQLLQPATGDVLEARSPPGRAPR